MQRQSVSAARRIVMLTKRYDELGGEPCPTCKRSSLRDEELTLKAAKEVLDRAGVSANPKGDLGTGGSGSVLVFPPGTQMAILPSSAQLGATLGTRNEGVIELEAGGPVRADLYAPRVGQGAP